MNTKKGFTLIELLVVVAIIGVVASIIMITVGDVRTRGGDAAVQSNLKTVQSQAEIFYVNHDTSYLPTGGQVFNSSPCPSVYQTNGTNMFTADKVMAEAIEEATQNGNTEDSRCYNAPTRWAVAIGLKSDENASWCVDSTGNSKQVASVPANAINNTTFICN